jgi:hypothetical protein
VRDAEGRSEVIRKLWTDERPKYSGYYWFKSADGEDVMLVEVSRGKMFYTRRDEFGVRAYQVKVKDATGKWSAPVPFPSLHRANKHEQGLKDLTLAVLDYLSALDAVMSEPSSPERGSKVAKLSNALTWANDRAMHFSLGMEFEAINALKRKRERLRIKARKAQANG